MLTLVQHYCKGDSIIQICPPFSSISLHRVLRLLSAGVWNRKRTRRRERFGTGWCQWQWRLCPSPGGTTAEYGPAQLLLPIRAGVARVRPGMARRQWWWWQWGSSGDCTAAAFPTGLGRPKCDGRGRRINDARRRWRRVIQFSRKQ